MASGSASVPATFGKHDECRLEVVRARQHELPAFAGGSAAPAPAAAMYFFQKVTSALPAKPLAGGFQQLGERRPACDRNSAGMESGAQLPWPAACQYRTARFKVACRSAGSASRAAS